MHSIYFEVLGEHGWIGLTIFLSLGLTALLTCSRIVKLWRDRPDLKWASDLAKMMQVCLVGYAAAGTFLNLATFNLFYHILTIIFLTRFIVGQELGQVRTASEPAYQISAEPDAASSSAEEPDGSNATLPDKAQPGYTLGGESGQLIKRR